MKKIQYTLAIAAIAFMASCGSKTEANETDSTTTTVDAAPKAAEPAAAPVEGKTDDKGTSIKVSKDGASMESEGNKVDVSKDKIEVIKR